MSSQILLIEDTEDLGEMIRDTLAINGFQVTWARDGEQGIQAFGEINPDLVITDFIMPHLNGLEAIRLMRARPISTEIPIIMLSARTSPEDQAKAMESGASLFLKKPCNSSVLVQSVRSLLGTK